MANKIFQVAFLAQNKLACTVLVAGKYIFTMLDLSLAKSTILVKIRRLDKQIKFMVLWAGCVGCFFLIIFYLYCHLTFKIFLNYVNYTFGVRLHSRFEILDSNHIIRFFFLRLILVRVEQALYVKRVIERDDLVTC